MSGSNGLPKGWAEADLGSVVRPRSQRVSPAEHGHLPYIGLENVEADVMRLVGTVPAHTMKSSSARFYPTDLLYGRLRPYLNKVFQPTFDGLCSAEFIVLPESGVLNSRFLQYRINAGDFVAFTSQLNTGDRPRVDFEQLGDFRIRIPPLPEQRRIVEKLEELLSDLDAGVASLRRAKANLKRYRASVLKSAVEGRLTEEWRKEHPQIEDGQVLLDRILRERREKWGKAQLAKFKERGKEPPKNWQSKYKEPLQQDAEELPHLPDGWIWASLDALCCLIADIDHNMPKSVERGMKFLSAKDLMNDGTLNLTEGIKLISEEDYVRLSRKATPQRNDIIYSRIGACLGKARLVETDERFLVSYSCCTIRTVIVSPLFVARYLDCGFVLRRALAGTQSIGVPDLGLDKIKRFPVPLCSLEEAAALIDVVEERLSQIDSAEKTIDTELVRSKRLRQSILKRAFEGQLVPQDPQDEPASILLERIKASREAEQPKKEPKKVKVK